MARLQRPSTPTAGPDPEDVAAVSATIMSWRPSELTVELEQVAALVSCLAEAGGCSRNAPVTPLRSSPYIQMRQPELEPKPEPKPK